MSEDKLLMEPTTVADTEMTGRYGTNRADGDRGRHRASENHQTESADSSNSDTGNCNSGGDAGDAVDTTPVVSAAHRREWQRWILETVTAGTASVVPVSQLVALIDEREPDDIGRSTIKSELTDQLLSTIEREPGLEYDVDRQVVINYGN